MIHAIPPWIRVCYTSDGGDDIMDGMENNTQGHTYDAFLIDVVRKNHPVV
jgi:hypothetical protein